MVLREVDLSESIIEAQGMVLREVDLSESIIEAQGMVLREVDSAIRRIVISSTPIERCYCKSNDIRDV